MAVIAVPRSNTRRPSPLRGGVAAIVAASALPIILAATVAFTGALVGGDPGSQPVAPGAPASEEPSPSERPTASPTPRPTPTATPSQTPTPTPTPTLTPTYEPTTQPTVAPTARPTPTPAPAPNYARPGGVYLDVLTPLHGYGDWSRSLLDTIFMLPSHYYPGDLVDTSAAGLDGGYAVRSIVIADLRAMADAARANGTPIAVVSGFRSHAQQQSTFDYWVSVGGYEQALRTSARAGHSEHQLGTTIDFTSAGGGAPWELADWATTPAGAWMKANAWRYGFVMSYPAGGFMQTGYDYEPWHYRYVGRELAAQIVASGVTPREVLWTLQP